MEPVEPEEAEPEKDNEGSDTDNDSCQDVQVLANQDGKRKIHNVLEDVDEVVLFCL